MCLISFSTPSEKESTTDEENGVGLRKFVGFLTQIKSGMEFTLELKIPNNKEQTERWRLNEVG